MVIKTQKELEYVLLYPTCLLPERLLITFDKPDFKGKELYALSPEGMEGEFVLIAA